MPKIQWSIRDLLILTLVVALLWQSLLVGRYAVCFIFLGFSILTAWQSLDLYARIWLTLPIIMILILFKTFLLSIQ